MDVTVTDATASGRETARLVLERVPTPVTLRDLIRFRVREEAARYNADPVTRLPDSSSRPTRRRRSTGTC